ncbi:alpha/beta hydrolase [Kitasatospora kifunensis]|uniref:Acetyl esterase/lipase n=1 Tax=Kitasatospora kifunensis TaxID=58351 RepID=A0A7W7R9Q1_KITKI|nr:alpha/beta hydrolase [Kitasatospora kifunensis]MBB4927966.1 acetyl esterase/lipase [Kitasatospora kifunensis]
MFEEARPPQPPVVLEPEARAFVAQYGRPQMSFGGEPQPSRSALPDPWVAPLDDPGVVDEWLALPGDRGERIRVRILRPAGSEDLLPVILYLRGLGWMFNDSAAHHRLATDLALGADAAVVVPEYDRPPAARYPAAVEQSYAVARWIAEQGVQAGLDGTRMAAVGDCAGGNLVAALTLLAKQRGGVRLVQQVLLCPVTDAGLDTASHREFADGYVLGRSAMHEFWQQYVPDPRRRSEPAASPLRAPLEDLAGLPPALVVTAEADVLRDEGEAYAARLRAAGVPVVSVRYHGTVHGFLLLDALWGSAAATAARIQTIDTLHVVLHRYRD